MYIQYIQCSIHNSQRHRTVKRCYTTVQHTVTDLVRLVITDLVRLVITDLVKLVITDLVRLVITDLVRLVTETGD